MKLKTLIDVDILYGIGFILAFTGQAALLSNLGFLAFLEPMRAIGLLLVVAGAVISIWNKFRK